MEECICSAFSSVMKKRSLEEDILPPLPSATVKETCGSDLCQTARIQEGRGAG